MVDAIDFVKSGLVLKINEKNKIELIEQHGRRQYLLRVFSSFSTKHQSNILNVVVITGSKDEGYVYDIEHYKNVQNFGLLNEYAALTFNPLQGGLTFEELKLVNFQYDPYNHASYKTSYYDIENIFKELNNTSVLEPVQPVNKFKLAEEYNHLTEEQIKNVHKSWESMVAPIVPTAANKSDEALPA